MKLNIQQVKPLKEQLKTTKEVQKTTDLFAEINGREYEDLQLVLEAFKKDSKKLLGIAKKILK